ncbi:MAG: hypothetical protein LIP16_05435 [Clostridium sp.]|nr:hypothetical protein [Clostridium sp.]
MLNITTDTSEWIYKTFLNMPNDEFAMELKTLNTALDLYLTGEGNLVDSFVREYLDDLFEIARDALVSRYVCEQLDGLKKEEV